MTQTRSSTIDLTDGSQPPSSSPDQIERATRIVLRPIANPLPLGFLALASGTILLTALQLSWIGGDQTADVALLLIAFVAPLQALTSVLGYLARDVVAGTGMGILAGTWVSIGLVMQRGAPGATSRALALLLAMSAVGLALAACGAALGKLVPALVLATTSVRFAVTAAHQWTASESWRTIAGAVGLALAVLAVYAAVALLLEDVRRATVLPLWRRGRGARSITGAFDEQLEHLEREAGVREQL
jgi:succinate-acetate transporter protein